MKQETYNKLEDIIHDLYEFTSMIESEAKESAMKSGRLTGEIARINKVMFRIISDLKTTKLHMHDIEKMEKINERFKDKFPKTTGPEPKSKTEVAGKIVKDQFKDLMENPNVRKIYVPKDKAKELGLQE